uniref:Carboxylic ester hydrolase (EC) n=1 Tax=Ganoderma boninense TaxID=34458 RepID=A0A5K1JXN1_9APHY|nr:Carboxylic ester hydrolase (EC [Ganoderma boninense]
MSDPPTTENPPKRKRGRPPGTKNKPDAGTKGNPVGRPRKNKASVAAPTVATSRKAAAAMGTVAGNTASVTVGAAASSETPRSDRRNPRGEHNGRDEHNGCNRHDGSGGHNGCNGHGGQDGGRREEPGGCGCGDDRSTEHNGHSLPSTATAEPHRARERTGSTTAPSVPLQASANSSSSGSSTPASLDHNRANIISSFFEYGATDHTPLHDTCRHEDNSIDSILVQPRTETTSLNMDEEMGIVPDDDDDTPSSVPGGGTTAAGGETGVPCPTPSRSTLPVWLQADYNEVCDHLRVEMERGGSGCPSCYDDGRFVLCPRNIVFSSRNIFNLNPALFYLPEYFVWIPHLLGERIPCPACRSAGRTSTKTGRTVLLQCKGWPHSPHRVVDMESNLYIIGYHYRCPEEACGKTYQSWSPMILDVLPAAVASQFTFFLTHRNALSDRLVALLRSSFQHGIGPVPFSEIIRMFHLRRYEHKHIQFLELVKSRTAFIEANFAPLHTPFSDWNDRRGFAGYVPSEHYFRNVYDTIIERYADELDQYSAMLPATILSIDHSHKVPKHLIKVEGEEVFSAMHTIVNQDVEIRGITFNPTKAHSQCMPALSKIANSLRLFGHPEVQLVYTDNVRSDKPEVKRQVPSLRKHVDPILVSGLTRLTIPSLWSLVHLGSKKQLKNRIDSMMDDLRKLPETASLPLAFDMEWAVDRESGIFSRVALITLVYQETIYLILLHSYINSDGFLHLPASVMNGTLGAYPGVSLSLFGLFASRVILIVLHCLANLSLVLAVQ